MLKNNYVVSRNCKMSYGNVIISRVSSTRCENVLVMYIDFFTSDKIYPELCKSLKKY